MLRDRLKAKGERRPIRVIGHRSSVIRLITGSLITGSLITFAWPSPAAAQRDTMRLGEALGVIVIMAPHLPISPSPRPLLMPSAPDRPHDPPGDVLHSAELLRAAAGRHHGDRLQPAENLEGSKR